MRRIADLLFRYKEYATAILLTIVSVILISSSSSSELRSFRTISVGVVASVQSALEWLPNPSALRSENHALRQLAKDLSLQSLQQRELAFKAAKYRDMLGFREKSPMKLLPAEVVAKTTIQLRNFATLNVGRRHGVREGMPVITERGLVGQVVGIDDRWAIVQLLLNRDTRIAARTLAGRHDGLVVWDGESGMQLRDLPSSLPQRKGDTVVTSNYSSIFPENLVIGTIGDIEPETGSLYYAITLVPAVDFATLEEAFVVLYTPDADRLRLEKRVLEGLSVEDDRPARRGR